MSYQNDPNKPPFDILGNRTYNSNGITIHETLTQDSGGVWIRRHGTKEGSQALDETLHIDGQGRVTVHTEMNGVLIMDLAKTLARKQI